MQLTEVEQAFKELKGDLAIRPIHHQLEDRIKAHIFISFLAYCLQVTLKARLRHCASGLTPRAVIEKFAAVQERLTRIEAELTQRNARLQDLENELTDIQE